MSSNNIIEINPGTKILIILETKSRDTYQEIKISDKK